MRRCFDNARIDYVCNRKFADYEMLRRKMVLGLASQRGPTVFRIRGWRTAATDMPQQITGPWFEPGLFPGRSSVCRNFWTATSGGGEGERKKLM